MKIKWTNLVVIFILSISIVSCEKEVKPVVKTTYSVEAESINLHWTAYKTTAKLPVKGTFTSVKILKKHAGRTPLESLDNLEFSISVNSIDSNKPERDIKLVTAFFGSMVDTDNITGIIKLDKNGASYVKLTMNGITEKLPIRITHKEVSATILATLLLDNWKGKLAIEALNKACNELHKGEDGISKTWDEVNLQIEVNFTKSN